MIRATPTGWIDIPERVIRLTITQTDMMNSPNETNTLEKITLLTKLIAPPKDIDVTWFDYKAGNFCAKKSKVQGRGYRLVGALNAKPEQNKGVLISMERKFIKI